MDKAKSDGMEILQLTGNELTLTHLKQACESSSLWGDERQIIIELGISKSPKEVVEYLIANQLPQIIIWEPAPLKATDSKKFTKSELKEFKLPTKLFEYLDSLGSNYTHVMSILNQLLQTEDEELVFIMTHKRIRQLVYLSSGGEGALNSVERLAPWQVGKLRKQAQNKPAQSWKDLYEKIINFDYNRKMGRTNLTCRRFIELNLE